MFNIHVLSGLANGTAQAIAQKQAMQGGGQKKRRKIKQGCRPCTAMAKVDATRARLGYSVK